jgi:hypothetical protein
MARRYIAGNGDPAPYSIRLYMTTDPKRLLTPLEAAKAWRVSLSKLAKDRVNGTGPEYIKIGRAVRYDPDALNEYIRQQARSSTSQDTIARGATRGT